MLGAINALLGYRRFIHILLVQHLLLPYNDNNSVTAAAAADCDVGVGVERFSLKLDLLSLGHLFTPNNTQTVNRAKCIPVLLVERITHSTILKPLLTPITIRQTNT